MKLLVKDITIVVSEITDLVNGDKTVPGVMLSLGTNEMKVRYSDGKKSFSGTVYTEYEDGDIQGDIVVDYSRLVAALSKCQPSGIIVVDCIRFVYPADGVIEIKAQQKCLVDGDNGEEEYRVLAEKTMQLNWSDVKSSLKTAILGRMDYDSIFNASITDEWDIEELQDIMTRCGTEKSRIIYMSPSIQKAFVANVAHVTAIPVSKLEVSPMDVELLKGKVSGEEFETEKNKLYNRMKFPATISTTVAKQVCGILSKIGKGVKVYTHAEKGFFSIFTEDERTGIWFAMAEGSKAQTTQFERFSSMEYDSYQINFVREFLVDAIKSAVMSSASEKLAFSFVKNENDEMEIVLAVTNSNASVNDVYKVVCDDCIDTIGNIEDRQLQVSLKVFNDMLSQLKTEVVGMDIKIMDGDQACIRLAEIDSEKAIEKYYETRERLGLQDIEPTPVEEKVKYRSETLLTTQYTLVSK